MQNRANHQRANNRFLDGATPAYLSYHVFLSKPPYTYIRHKGKWLPHKKNTLHSTPFELF